jgi:signal transduction histidine kinase
MHRKPGAFNRYHLRDALATSALFTLAIEREAMEQRFRGLNKLQLAGQLASGLSHEVNNKVTGLDAQLRNLQADCRRFERQGYQPEGFGDIQQALNQFSSTFDDLKHTVQLFQRLVRFEEERAASINEVLQETIFLLKPLAGQQSVRIETELSHDLPSITGNITQLQQIFLNLTLNAIQHMALKPSRGRTLNVTTFYEGAGKECPIKIRFSDTGPGIHRQLWEKIFDLGFTTRPGGTGQGLYLARSLVESLKGKMGVERSVILLGTTFLIELP